MIEREIPESQITCIADQFCRAAELLYVSRSELPAVQAMRVNAVLSIELYLKSLDSHWIRTNYDDLNDDMSLAISSKSNAHGHKLDKLFQATDRDIQDVLNTAFALSPLFKSYSSLPHILTEYANTFEKERYLFETSNQDRGRPISETVELARFLRDTVHAMKRRQVWSKDEDDDQNKTMSSPEIIPRSAAPEKEYVE